MREQRFYALRVDGREKPVYVTSGLSSRPLQSTANDWFCWRDVLPPGKRVSYRKGDKVEYEPTLALGMEGTGYEKDLVVREIDRDEAFRLARAVDVTSFD
jgi:hypothetical protein